MSHALVTLNSNNFVIYGQKHNRLRAKKGSAPPPPPGNFADISYLEENFKPHLFKRCLHSVLWGVSL